MPSLESSAEGKAEADAKWCNQDWLKFPSVSLDEAAAWHYWDVPPDSGRYDGDWQDGARSGRGVYLWPGGGRYEGDWIDDRRSGYGVYLGANGEKYEGEFEDGRYHGRGVFVWPDGLKFEGGFKDGSQPGRGVLHVASGDRVHGEFQAGKHIGTGRCWRQDRNRWSRCRQDGEVIKDVNYTKSH